jgi:hypothetical protein
MSTRTKTINSLEKEVDLYYEKTDVLRLKLEDLRERINNTIDKEDELKLHLDSNKDIQKLKDSIKKLKTETKALDVKNGLIQSSLLNRLQNHHQNNKNTHILNKIPEPDHTIFDEIL